MSKPKYPRKCKKYGHNHTDYSIYINNKPQPFHITQCLNYGGIWPFRKRCEHTEEWTPDLGMPPISIFRDVPSTPTIKKGDTVYITISGTGDRKPMRVVNVTN